MAGCFIRALKETKRRVCSQAANEKILLKNVVKVLQNIVKMLLVYPCLPLPYKHTHIFLSPQVLISLSVSYDSLNSRHALSITTKRQQLEAH